MSDLNPGHNVRRNGSLHCARHSRLFALAALLACTLAGAAERRVVISGEVYATNTQALLTPPSNSSPVVLRNFVREGERVRKGDVVLSIDGGQAASSIRQFKSERTQAQARADKEIAELEVAAIDAERKLRTAEGSLAKAKLDAALPAAYLAKLDYDRYQGELKRTERELEVARTEWNAAVTAVDRRRQDAALEVNQLSEKIAYWEAQVDAAVIYAEGDGVVVHGFDPRTGLRYDEGSSAFPGQRLGSIITGEHPLLAVRGFALEVDRPALTEGASVEVSFDALGGRAVTATIQRIAGAPQPKAEWGEGRYFEIEIALPQDFALPVLPGSSARVSTVGAAQPRPSQAPAGRARFDGEIVALDSSAIAPPAIEDTWMLTLTQLAPDGSPVTEGQVVAAFDGNELMRNLATRQASLNEKRTQLQSLELALAERERTERIATAEQKAALEKAQRKATQPAELIKANDYRKLVIDRKTAEAEMEIVSRREVLAARQRKAEHEQLSAEVRLLDQQVTELQQGLAALNVKAPRAGVMLHLSNWQGEKYDVGSQVFREMAVAQIPDLSRLAVRMQVPERLLGTVRAGQRVAVNVEGGAVPTLSGTVVAIGRVVRSRSRANPIPVVDADIELRDVPVGAKLKPGQPVRVDLHEEAAP